MKKEYQALIDRDVAHVNNAKTDKQKKEAAIALDATKSVINALLFNEREMKKLS